jgi:hypothetical protein
MATRTPTTNYDLGKYAAHDSGISADLNLNLDKIDTALQARVPSTPPSGSRAIVNIYFDPVTGKVTLVYGAA